MLKSSVTQQQREEADKLRPLMHQCIGEALNTFNILEDLIRQSVMLLLKTEDPFVVAPLLGQLSTRQLVDIFCSLATIESSQHPDLEKLLKQLKKSFSKRLVQRNDLVHSVWGIELVNKKSTGMFKSRYARAKIIDQFIPESKTFSEDDFTQLISDFESTYDSLHSFMESLLLQSKQSPKRLLTFDKWKWEE